MKVAIVHYWLVGMRGGERVLEALLDIYPDADVYTHVVDHKLISKKISSHVVATTFIQKLPLARKFYQFYLPLMPLALEQLDLSAYDLIFSSESGPAKGIITSPDSVHICYCHSPMRYVWDMYHQYKQQAGFFKKLLLPWLIHRLRIWDLASSFRVDHFIANSSFVQKRLKKFYHRNSEVIYPPIDTKQFKLSDTLGNYYLMVGQLVAYKNTHIAVEAFNLNNKKLIIIGEGCEFKKLSKSANSNIIFMGYQSFSVIKQHYANCKALIFPGVEDFGMVPVEAMASGRPVIALKQGGALDTVKEGLSGVFFDQPKASSLNQAIDFYEKNIEQFDPIQIKQYAQYFHSDLFKQNILDFVAQHLNS